MKRSHFRLLLCLLLAPLAGCGSLGATTTPDQPASQVASQLLRLTNAARAEGRQCPDGQFYPAAQALTYSRQLEGSAQTYADLLASGDDFPRDTVHTDLQGRTFSQRIVAAGYTPVPGAAYDSGENVQGGASSPEDAVRAWLSSKNHCPNLMDPDFAQMGMGYASRAGTAYGTYWVQDLGRR